MNLVDDRNILPKEKVVIDRYYLSAIVACVFILYSLSGSTAANSLYISMAILVAWTFISLFTDHNSFITMFKHKKIAWFVLYVGFLIITALFSVGIFEIAKLVGSAFQLFSSMIIISYYVVANKARIIKFLLIISCVGLIYFASQNILFYIQNPGAARALASNRSLYGDVSLGGGYALAYASTIMAVYLFDLLLNRMSKNKWFKLLLIFSITVLVTLVFETRSTFTIIVLIIGLILSLILQIPRKIAENPRSGNIHPRQIVMILVLACFVVMFISSYKQIGYFIMEQTASSEDIVNKRIREIGVSMAYGSDSVYGTTDLKDRLERPLISLHTFIENPLIGAGYKYGYDFYRSKQYLGNHCEWADALGSLGIIGGVPFLLSFFYAIRDERKIMGGVIPPTYVIVLGLLGLFNPLRTFQSLFVFFFIIPAFALVLKDKKGEM